MPAQNGPLATRTLRSGETLLKPGDKVKSVYLIQSGRISLCMTKGGKTAEIAQLIGGQSICEEAAFGALAWNMTALALRDTVVTEVPLEAITEPLNQSTLGFKNLLKALNEKLKVTFNEVKALKLNRDSVPCPGDHVAKVFGVIYHTSRCIGKMDESETTSVADWEEFRRFAFEVFNESVVRVEDAVGILLKLGYAEFEGRQIRLKDLKQVESFFDYFGSYYFKGGNEDLLKTNPKMQKVTEEFLKIADTHPTDRGGNQHLPYKPTIDAMKKAIGSGFEADQLFRLEQKGLFMKRTTTQDGGVLSFYRPDFDQMVLNWRFLREIEIWNEKGFVDMGGVQSAPVGKEVAPSMLDPTSERKKWAKALESWTPVALGNKGAPQIRQGDKAKGEVWCSVCMSVLARNQKACSVCGAEANSG